MVNQKDFDYHHDEQEEDEENCDDPLVTDGDKEEEGSEDASNELDAVHENSQVAEDMVVAISSGQLGLKSFAGEVLSLNSPFRTGKRCYW